MCISIQADFFKLNTFIILDYFYDVFDVQNEFIIDDQNSLPQQEKIVSSGCASDLLFMNQNKTKSISPIFALLNLKIIPYLQSLCTN